MTALTERMAAVASRLLGPDRLGADAGAVQFWRVTPGVPVEEWEVAPPTRVELPVRANAFGVGKELVGAPVPNGGQIIATDVRVVAEVTDFDPGKDEIWLDGKVCQILSVKQIPAAGVASVAIFIVRA